MKYRFPTFIPAIYDRILCVWARAASCSRSWILNRLWGVHAGPGVRYTGKTFIRSHGGDISIGAGTIFVSNPRINLVGLMNPTILDTLKGGCISIGKNCGLSSVVISSKSSVKIGNRVLVGGNVRIFDHDYHSLDHSKRGTCDDIKDARTLPIEIGDDVFVGTGAIILKGTKIGDRSVVAAGSVVFGLEVGADSLVKGNPAMVFAKKYEKK